MTSQAVDSLRDRLSLTAYVAVAAVIASTALNGLPADHQDAAAVVIVTAVAMVALLLATRFHDNVPVGVVNTVAGLAGAALVGLQPSGPGYIISFIAIAALGLRLPRRPALAIGAVILVAAATTEALNSPQAASSTLGLILGAGFLLLTSAFAAASQESHNRSLQLLHQEEATRAAREEAAVLAERGRLARELHDVLAHTLSGLSLQLEGARLLAQKTHADPALTEQISHAGRLAREGLLGAKSAVSTLRGDTLPGPAQLPELVANACRSGLLASLEIVGEPRRVAGDIGLAVYRCVQEALTNSTKYAGAGAVVAITVTWADDAVGVEILDGGGNPEPTTVVSGGFGLAGLSERAALAGGQLETGPYGDGWRVALRMPLRPAPVPRMIRVLIADDQKIVRDGLAMLLGLLDGIEVVGTALDGADALRQAASLDPDIVLMDLNMPVLDGVEATRQLVSSGSRTRVVVLTTYADDDWVFRALQAGARGFLTKDAGAQEIQAAIVTVAAGEAQLDPSVQRRLLEALAVQGTPASVPAPADGLTSRELEVLVEISQGLSNTEIAGRLFVSEATVKTHVNHLLAKTGCRDRAALVAYAYRTGRAL